MTPKKTEYAVEWARGGLLVEADSEEEALRIAWEYADLRIGVGGDKSKLTVREIEDD